MRFIHRKFKDWFGEFWNKVDIISYILFIAAVSVRFSVGDDYFTVARVFFCCSLLIYFVRFTQLFFVLEQLGPKIIMIKKMVNIH